MQIIVRIVQQKAITVKPNPAKPIVIAISNSQLQSTAANSYQWFLNNTLLSSASNQTLTITQNGILKSID